MIYVDDQVIDQIKNILIDRGETIAVAESLTSGHLQVALASAENASEFFQGGITVYNLGQRRGTSTLSQSMRKVAIAYQKRLPLKWR